MTETIVFSEYFKKHNSSSEIIFEGDKNYLKIKKIEYDKLQEVKILKSDNYEIHIDDIDKNIFKIECIEFKNCSFKDVYFESFKDGRQNVVLLISANQDNNEIQRNIKPDFYSKTTKENLHYPKLYFNTCMFKYFGIKKAEVDHENNEVSSEDIKLYAFFIKIIFNYELYIKTCKFKSEFEIINTNINSDFYFEDINFSKTFKISKSNFNKNIKFKNIVFDSVVLMNNSYEEIQMEKVNFTKAILFSNNEIIKKAYFKNMIIDKTDSNNILELEFKCKENSEIEFSECFVYRKIIFIGCFYNVVLGIKFHEDVYFKNIFHDNVFFENINFNNKQILSVNQFKKEVSFFKVNFDDGIEIEDDFLQEKNISFKSCKFKKIIAFRKKNIKNITFGTCTFKQGVYFVSCVFSIVNFYNCNFNNAACFYGSTFNMAPNFSQSVFKDSLNLVNIKTKFDFQNLNTTIENICKPKDEAANDFRDSFRTFKSALIKDNNLLDASNFHKYELYCKEIELKNKKGKTFKDVVDRWQLIFYRKLCDHHTDILQSLNSLILVIGIFVISSVAMVVGFNYSLGYKPILEHWYFSLDFYNHHINSIIQDNYLLMIFVNLMILFIYLGLVGFALCLKYMREFFIIISYVITLLVLAVSPKILIPAMGIFTDKRAMLDPLSVFGGIYTIIFGFVAFSFIKTIRKNSIVPS